MNADRAQKESNVTNAIKAKKTTANPAEKSAATTVSDRLMIAYDGKQTTEDLIRFGAYLRWEAAGCPDGDGVGFWLDSEREFLEQPVRMQRLAP